MNEPTQPVLGTRIDRRVPEYSHAVRQYFRDHSIQVVSLQDLAPVISDHRTESQRRVATRLNHVTLPKLADVGVIDYDARSNTARCRDAELGNHRFEDGDG